MVRQHPSVLSVLYCAITPSFCHHCRRLYFLLARHLFVVVVIVFFFVSLYSCLTKHSCCCSRGGSISSNCWDVKQWEKLGVGCDGSAMGWQSLKKNKSFGKIYMRFMKYLYFNVFVQKHFVLLLLLFCCFSSLLPCPGPRPYHHCFWCCLSILRHSFSVVCVRHGALVNIEHNYCLFSMRVNVGWYLKTEK